MVVYYRKQKFGKLRKKHQTSRELFTDPEFPPSNNSLFIGGTAPPHVGNLDIVWKRPADICSKGRTPKLVVDGLSSRDLNQGQLGNCWFVAACSALALEKKLWNKVIPDYKSQEWKESEPHRYAGIFHFQFWRLGKWTDIVVDDFLPTIDGKLIYTRSDDDHEFWSALLEKAYAKLAGSYEALSGGRTADALVDFTGGVSETIDIHEEGYTSDEEKQLQLFDTIKSAHKQKALISCNIALGRGDEPESVLDCGLVKGHAYSIIDIRNLNLNQSIFSFINKDMCYLIKLRNPWGQTEWNGPWSDRSEEWTKVTKKDRIKLGIEVADDGEFWMELSDWVQWFTSVCICRQVNTKLLSLETTWHEALFDGSWRNPMAGGCVNNKDTFCNNPQYSFMILKDDQEVMVSLMQRDVRDQKGMVDRGAVTVEDADVLTAPQATGESGGATQVTLSKQGMNYTIGYHIMKVEENRRFRCHTIQETAATSVYTNKRSVFDKFRLNAGRYVIVPTTFEPGLERDFLLRIFTLKPSKAEYLKQDYPKRSPIQRLFFCCFPKVKAVVTVYLDNAEGLHRQGANPYCVVKVEKKKARTPIKKSTVDPNFNTKVHFFISRPETAHVTVQIMNRKKIFGDKFMGQREVAVPTDGLMQTFHERLMGKGRQNADMLEGTITFRVLCSTDLHTN